ncbi:ABC transporter permease [Thermococcus chitonophagus]|uniref:ABC transporter permease n=1 Tax=Thermococcus chitonophagus TaxID=54262 RepID=UPI000A4A9D90|nr:ABC transporter permease [Thermococcus chitonophagus]
MRFLALAKASLLTARRYRIDWYGNVLVPVLTVVPVIIALWYGKKIGLGDILGTENYFEYYILGIAYWNYVEVVWSSIFVLRYYMRTDQLEDMLLTPLTPLEYILGWSLLGIAVTTVTSLPLVALAVIMGLIGATVSEVAVSVVVFLLSITASFGLAYLIFGLTLVIREGDEVVSLIGNMAPLIGGLYFPITLLPGPLRHLSYAFPFTWGVDVLRALLTGSRPIFGVREELLILFALTLLYLTLGVLSYKFLERTMRRKGIQGF